jgi:hypothetical protein
MLEATIAAACRLCSCAREDIKSSEQLASSCFKIFSIIDSVPQSAQNDCSAKPNKRKFHTMPVPNIPFFVNHSIPLLPKSVEQDVYLMMSIKPH